MKRPISGQQGYGDQDFGKNVAAFGVNLVLFRASLAALVVLIVFLVLRSSFWYG